VKDTASNWEIRFFSAKVKSRLVENKNDLRSNSVSFDGVNFRASKSFRTGIRGDLERRRCIGFRTSKEWNREQLEQIVLQHIRKHGFITRATYTELTGRLKNPSFLIRITLHPFRKYAHKLQIVNERHNKMHLIATSHSLDNPFGRKRFEVGKRGVLQATCEFSISSPAFYCAAR